MQEDASGSPPAERNQPTPVARARVVDDEPSLLDRVLRTWSGSLIARGVVQASFAVAPILALMLFGPQTGIAAGLGAAGLRGGDAVFVAMAGRRAARRVDALLRHVSELEAKVKCETLREEVLESEDFADLALDAVEAATRTRDDEKIRQYAAILVGSASADAPPDLESQSVLRALADLTLKQVRLLALVFAHGELAIYTSQARHGPSFELPEELQRDLMFDLRRIEATGLLTSESIQPLMGGHQGQYWTPTVTVGRIRGLLRAGGYELPA